MPEIVRANKYTELLIVGDFFENDKDDPKLFTEEICRQNKLYPWDRMNEAIESLYGEITGKTF